MNDTDTVVARPTGEMEAFGGSRQLQQQLVQQLRDKAEVKYPCDEHAGTGSLMAGVPASDPLPVWLSMPLATKLPMIRGPKNTSILYTTDIGEPVHCPYPGQPFDLTNPNNYGISSEYRPLNDPYLKPMLRRRRVRDNLEKRGLITTEGKVKCTLREFNEFRRHLHKYNMGLTSKLEEYESFHQTPEWTMSEKRAMAASAEGYRRMKKVNETRIRRLRKQNEAIKESTRLNREQTERQERWSMDEKDRLKAIAANRRLSEERRAEVLSLQRAEERSRHLDTTELWEKTDVARDQRMRKTAHEDKQQHARKLYDSWEDRKSFQREAFVRDAEDRATRAVVREMNLVSRNEAIMRVRQGAQARFVKVAEQCRKERMEKEADSHRKRQDSQTIHVSDMILQKRKIEKQEATQSNMKSYWDLETELRKQIVSRDMPGQMEKTAVAESDDLSLPDLAGDISDVMSEESKDSTIKGQTEVRLMSACQAMEGQAISCLSIKLSEGSAKPSGEAATEVADVAEVNDTAATAAAADGDDDGNAEKPAN